MVVVRVVGMGVLSASSMVQMAVLGRMGVRRSSCLEKRGQAEERRYKRYSNHINSSWFANHVSRTKGGKVT